MSLYKTFETSRTSENDGIWLTDFPANDDGTVPGFKIARKSKNNVAYSKAAEKLGKRLQREISLDILTNAQADPALKTLFIETILLDWRNVMDRDNKPIPYSKENAAKLFEDLPDLFVYLDGEAEKLSNFRKAELEEDTGN
jgi:hypothetical protein